jgi:AcrR family transcriptional regulator
VRQTLDQTRKRLLDTALVMLEQRGLFVGVTHVRLSEVVAEAGMTTGAAYRCWDDQTAFHRDLALAAVRQRDQGTIDRTVQHIRHLVDARAPLPEVLRVAAAANLHRYPEDAAFLITIPLRMTSPSDPELAQASGERHREAMTSFVSLYDALLGVYERRCVRRARPCTWPRRSPRCPRVSRSRC